MSAATAPSPLAPRSRSLTLGILAAGLLMNVLDGSIVTVAMPAIQKGLDFPAADLSWVVNAYLIAFGSLLLLAGRLGDLVGRKRMLLGGTAVFTAASMLAGMAASPAALLTARFLQGIGSAMVSAVGLGILITVFTEPRERAGAIGVFSFTGAAGASLGQVLGGVLTDALDWHWIFFINLPIGIAILAIAVPVLPADRGSGTAAGADVLGALLVTTGLMTGIYTVVEVEEHGWLSTPTLGSGGIALLLIGAFVARQATARNPLMPLRILRSRRVSGANLVQVLMVAPLFAFQFLVALYLQKVLAYGAAGTGLAMLPAAVAIGATSLCLSARLISGFGARRVLLSGIVLLAAALGLLARAPADADYVTDLLPVMLLAAGFGLALPALTSLGMADAGEDDAGLASGLFNTTQQIGMALGVAVLSTIAASRTGQLLARGAGGRDALTGGYHLAFAVGAGLLAAAFTVAFVVLRDPEGAAAESPPNVPSEATERTSDSPTAKGADP